jgi:Arc/MetJ-type ribon-helix-helix transcriptional regulator
LLAAQDVTIREGVRALLAQHDAAAEKLAQQRDGLGWSAWQGAEQQALAVSRADRSHWADFADASQRDAALERFREYAYQWY